MLFYCVLSFVFLCCQAASIERRDYAGDDDYLDYFYGSPVNDKFYHPAVASYVNETVGTILNYRKLASPKNVRNVKEVYVISYRTKYTNGDPQASVTTLFVPKTANPIGLMSYQVAEDAAFIECAPSYDILAKDAKDTGLQDLLDRGYYVNVPDYEGPDSSFAAGIQAGQATLDSIRAIYNSEALTGFNKTLKTVMYGYSGGSFATAWASQLQTIYARELNIVGAGLGGLIANLTALFEHFDNSLMSGFIPTAMAGLSTQYSDFNELLKEELTEEGHTAIKRATSSCLLSNILSSFMLKTVDMFTSREKIFQHPIVERILSENSLGGVTPKGPLYIHHALDDTVSPVGEVENLVYDYCNEGVPIEYVVNKRTFHLSEQYSGQPMAFDYLTARILDKPFKQGCHFTTRDRPAPIPNDFSIFDYLPI